MPITSSDLQYRLSQPAAAAGDVDASTPGESLGGFVSTTVLSGTALGALFDDVTGDEAANGETEYRCLFVHNAHATLTLLAPVVWLTAEAAETIALSVDTTAASPVDAAAAQAKTVTGEDTPPASQTFASPTVKADGLALGDLGPGEVRGIWFRRTVAAGATAVNDDTVAWRVEGDTNA